MVSSGDTIMAAILTPLSGVVTLSLSFKTADLLIIVEFCKVPDIDGTFKLHVNLGKDLVHTVTKFVVVLKDMVYFVD